MGVGYNPRIVTDGLVLCLDAANIKSYPGSGTTISDVSGNGRSGTLQNGISASNSVLTFDGTNDYVSISANSLWGFPGQGGTIIVWSKRTSGTGWVIGYQKGGWEGYLIGTGSIDYSGQSGSNDFNAGFSVTNNVWYMITFVVDRTGGFYYFYRNNATLINSKAISHPALTATQLYLGARGDVPDGFFNGQVGNFMFYNRALTAAEIQQNFNATRGRYGI